MIGLHKLEQTTGRRHCCPKLTRRIGINADKIPFIITLVTIFFGVIFLIFLLLTQNRQKVIENPIPYHDIIANAQAYYSNVQKVIGMRLELELPSQQYGLALFQQEQQKLSELLHSKHSHSRIGTVLNSIYTAEPIFVPQIHYLLALPGSCHAIQPALELTPRSGATGDHDGMKGIDSNTNNININAEHDEKKPICYPCNDKLIALYPTLLTAEYCKLNPIVSVYECDGDDDGNNNTNNDNKNNSDNDKQHQDMVIVPCTSAYVDGVQQYWALYSIAIILTLTSSILVRCRFDKAQAKVLKKLVKPQQR